MAGNRLPPHATEPGQGLRCDPAAATPSLKRQEVAQRARITVAALCRAGFSALRADAATPSPASSTPALPPNDEPRIKIICKPNLLVCFDTDLLRRRRVCARWAAEDAEREAAATAPG